MGKAYHVKCEKCDWNEVFYLGVGLNDGEEEANEAMKHLFDSEHGNEYDAFIRSQERASFRIERNLYRCRHCGRLQVRLQAQIHGVDTIVSPAYYCDNCGKMLGKVRPNMIKKQPCPVCKGSIVVEKTTEWDIAPKAESAIRAQKPQSDDGTFYCPVFDGRISQYDCDDICCGVNNGWVPNDGIPPIMEMKDIKKKAAICRKCPRH